MPRVALRHDVVVTLRRTGRARHTCCCLSSHSLPRTHCGFRHPHPDTCYFTPSCIRILTSCTGALVIWRIMIIHSTVRMTWAGKLRGRWRAVHFMVQGQVLEQTYRGQWLWLPGL